MRKGILTVFLAGALMIVGTSAEAGPTGTLEWNNATFTVELQNVAGNEYTFEIVADFSEFSEVDQTGHFDYLIGINFKPNGGNVTGIVDASEGDDLVNQDWDYGVDNLSSSSADCGPASSNDYFCGILLTANTTDWLQNPTAETLDRVYSWTFTLAITGVTDPNDLVDGAPLRALFTDEPNTQGKYQTSLMSEQSFAVPEPASFSLLAFGLAGVGAIRRYLPRAS